MRNIDAFDNFLFGKLNAVEKEDFQKRLASDPQFSEEFSAHQQFVNLLKEGQEKLELKSKLKNIHLDSFGKANVHSIKQGEFKKHLKSLSYAAAVALIATITTLTVLYTNGLLNYNSNANFTPLNKVNNNHTPSLLPKKKDFTSANTEGTGFLLNNKGYFITSLHVVNGADSVFIDNASISSASAKIVFSDERLDLAILKLDQDSIFKDQLVPFVLEKNLAELGDKIFTLGYPASDVVYGEGIIASNSGSGDTAMYQVSTPVNPGNSGGPLLNDKGYVVGLIRGKNGKAENTGFAVKSKYIYEAIEGISDSELKSDLKLSKRNLIKNYSRNKQIKQLQSFIFNVHVYKKN